MDNNCNFTANGQSVNSSLPIDYDKLFENCSFDNNFPQVKLPSGPNKDVDTTLRLLFYILAALENLLLIYVIHRDPLKRFRNAPSYFIANFTLADMVSIVSGIFDSIFQMYPRKDLQNQEIAGCFTGIGLQSSFMIIMIFAFDRYLAIAHPFKYQNIVQRKLFLAILLLFPWCFATITLPVIYFSPNFKEGQTLTNLYAGDIITLTCISLFVHPATYCTFKKKIVGFATGSSINKHLLAENLKIAKVYATTVLVVSVSLITFKLPYLVAFFFNLAKCDKCYLSNAFLSFWKYYPLLMAFRLMTNPIIYAWRLPLYSQSLKVLFFSNGGCIRNQVMRTSGACRSHSTESTSHTPDKKTSKRTSKNIGFQNDGNIVENNIAMNELSNLPGSPTVIKIEAFAQKEENYDKRF